MDNKNILITSVGRRSQLIKYFRKEFFGQGRIIVTDSSLYAPAIYEADKYYIVPRIDEPNYIKSLIDICDKEEISAVMSLIDPELSILAENKKMFEELGVSVMSSSYVVCTLCFDKYKMFEFCMSEGILTPKTYNDLKGFKKELREGGINFPVFLKARFGSASKDIEIVKNMNDLEGVWKKKNGLIIQEFMDGQEYGVDAYVDHVSGKIISIFIKEKIAMRAGETDKATSVKDEKFLEYITKTIKIMGLRGQIDMDFFKDGEQYYLLEINPRFGGGYPLAYECGCDFPRYIHNNLFGKANEPEIGFYPINISMLKQNAYIILEEGKKR